MLLKRCKRSSVSPVTRICPRRYVASHSRVSDPDGRTQPSALATTDPMDNPATQAPSIRETTKLKFAWLRSRSLIRLTGPDVSLFLQGLVSANITKFKLPSAATRPIYTAFLNAQGRVLYDVFLWRGHGADESGDAPWLIDVDGVSRGGLLAHLKKHKLRSKVRLESLSNEELRVYQGWIDEYDYGFEEEEEGMGAAGEAPHEPGSAPAGSSPVWTIEENVPVTDPRPGMGMRWLATAEATGYDAIRRAPGFDGSKNLGYKLAEEEEYTVHRTLRGIAEGQKEIITGSALPQESNIDFFDGIDFRKGCYLGQELTIRTHHTGVVRKRILPVQLYDQYTPAVAGLSGPKYNGHPGSAPRPVNGPLPPPGANISKVSSRGRSTGKWLGGVGNIGLALCRLEMMTDIRLTEEPTQYDPGQEFKISWDAKNEDGTIGHQAGEVRVKAFVPQWLRNSLIASLRSRERNSRKDEQDEVD